MHNVSFQRGSAYDRAAVGSQVKRSHVGHVVRLKAIGRVVLERPVSEQCDIRSRCPAKLSSRVDQRLENDLQVKRRTTDYFQYVGRGGLLLQRFAQLVG